MIYFEFRYVYRSVKSKLYHFSSPANHRYTSLSRLPLAMIFSDGCDATAKTTSLSANYYELGTCMSC